MKVFFSAFPCFLCLSYTNAFSKPSNGLVSRTKFIEPPLILPRAKDTSLSAIPGIAPIARTIGPSISKFLASIVREKIILSHVLIAFCIGMYYGRGRLPFARFKQVGDIPSHKFGPRARPLAGRAVSVSDGDTIRLLHTPTPFHPTELAPKQRTSTNALAVRICTIDTPETPKFGKPGQAFGKEAKQHLTDFLGSGPVYVRLLQRDQYGRAVAQVFKRKFFFGKQFVDEEMLTAGMAEVYQGGGAVYGPKGKEAYLELEKEAADAKLGIWSQAKRESAAEYKRRTKS